MNFIGTCTTATKIEQAGALDMCRAWVGQAGKSLLSWEVVLHRNVSAATCAACGGAFKEPPPGCGTAVWIEMRPDGDRLYHSVGSGKRDCRPVGIPLWHDVIRLAETRTPDAAQTGLFDFDEEL